MAHRATVNQLTQIGIESAHGTAVACNRLLEAFTVQFGPRVDVKTYRASGRRHPSAAVENTEMVEGKFSGEFDFNHILYIWNAIYGVSLTAHGASTTAYDYTITPALTGNLSPASFTLQHGDSVRAEQSAYNLFSGYSYKVSRKNTSFDASFFGQALTDNITLSASPTAVAQLPGVGKYFNVYLDTTSAGIGGTQLTNVIELSVDASDYFTQFWPVNRTNTSWAAHIDQAPKVQVKWMIEADSVGMGTLSSLQAGSRVYMRVDGVGPVIDAGNTANAGFRHDMALFVTGVSALEDKDGVYAIEWTADLAEDTSWGTGKAQIISGTCSLTAL